MKRLLALMLCLLCLAPGCLAEGSEGVLYRVTNGANTVYLLGSIHIGTKDMYPVGETLRGAIDRADAFLFECDTESAQAYVATMKATVYPDGEKLYDHLSEESYALVREAAQKLGMSASGLDSFRPWAVMSTFSLYLSAELMGESDMAAAQQYGVEAFVRGLIGERPVGYLETIDQQLDTLQSFSPELQDHLVATTCAAYLNPDQLTGTDADMPRWPEWWRDGRADLFAESYLSSYLEPGYEALSREYHEKLILQRNVGMADGIEAVLTAEGGGTTLVTVGLLHLVLPEGSVPALLQERGYTVEAVE